MSAISTRTLGAQQKRLAAYLDSLAQAAGHSDRIVPFRAYCTELLLPGERKRVERMAAKLALSVTAEASSMPIAFRLYVPEV